MHLTSSMLRVAPQSPAVALVCSEVMDGLSTIKPEIESFVSRENRSHADPWLQQVDWAEKERTLTLYVRRPPPDGCHDTVDGEELLATLTCSSLLRIYFPASLDEKPFCFCEGDDLVPAVEAANDRLRPLSCNSVLAVVTTVLKCVKRDAPNFQTKVSNSISGATRAIMAAEAVVSAIKEDPLAADLVLAFFGMAVSSYRRDTVSTPFPKQLESKGCKRAYAAFMSSLESIPDMVEVSRWTDARKLLKLPPVAVLVMHFVLVALPTKLRASKQTRCTSATGSSPVVSGGVLGESTVAPLAEAGAAVTASESSRANGINGRGPLPGGVRFSTQLGGVPSHVFEVLLPSDPVFDAEAKRGGSTVAYHGSSPENFHSILNTGLRVMSGSRLMKNGAAFGDGIYLSGSCNAAAAFAQRGDGSGTTVWSGSSFRAGDRSDTPPVASAPRKFQHRLVAKCRILKGEGMKEVKGLSGEESYFVVSDSSRIRVEGLLLFHEGQAREMDVDGTSAPKRANIRGASSATRRKVTKKVASRIDGISGNGESNGDVRGMADNGRNPAREDDDELPRSFRSSIMLKVQSYVIFTAVVVGFGLYIVLS